MIIILKLDEITFNIFPDLKRFENNVEHNTEAIKEYLTEYYTFSAFRPKVEIEDGFVKIEINTENIDKYYSDFQKAIKFCENKRFKEAKPILERLIKSNPANSEFHRVYGQVLETEGNWQEAINYLIDSLRWDPNNKYALIMLGNVYARYKSDIETATKYYNKALALDPNDYIAINNLGGNLVNLGRFDEAERYLQIAYEINDSYPNTSYGLALIYQKKGEYLKAFDFAIKCLKKVNTNDQFYAIAYSLVNDASTNYAKQFDASSLYEDYINKLKKICVCEIKIIEDSNINTPAKLEFAEFHNREEHIVKYQSKTPATPHLIMHELTHLDFATLASITGGNMLFTTNNEQRNQFYKDSISSLEKLEKQGLSDNQIKQYADSLFEGISQQMYNAPIDLFIEYKLYNEYPELRPVQFYSLHKLLGEYIQIATNKSIKETTPKIVREASNIMNLTHAMQFDLYPKKWTRS